MINLLLTYFLLYLNSRSISPTGSIQKRSSSKALTPQLSPLSMASVVGARTTNCTANHINEMVSHQFVAAAAAATARSAAVLAKQRSAAARALAAKAAEVGGVKSVKQIM